LPGDKGAAGGRLLARVALDRGRHRSILLNLGFYPISAGANGGSNMAVRLVVTITAAPGKGSQLAQAYKGRCEECMTEPGCEQFEVFQSVLNPDRLALLERWSDQAALDTHAQLNRTRPPLRPELRAGDGEREDYQYNRTR
jgi:quinol monooxygenase YgiN